MVILISITLRYSQCPNSYWKSELLSEMEIRFSNFCLTAQPHLPMRTFCKISMNTGSDCRWTWVSSKLICTHFSHAGLWKQKRTPFWSVSRITGGSCKKSPHRINCSPPNGLLFPLTARATRSSFCEQQGHLCEGFCLKRFKKIMKNVRMPVSSWSFFLIHGLDIYLRWENKKFVQNINKKSGHLGDLEGDGKKDLKLIKWK
jgi:hypothetical protein